MAPGFSFPPPPPPPPKPAGPTYASPISGDRGRGRGGRGQSRGRGGTYNARGSHDSSNAFPPSFHQPPGQIAPGSYINPNFVHGRDAGTTSTLQSHHAPQAFSAAQIGQKRKRDGNPNDASGPWRGGHGQTSSNRPRPMKQHANQQKIAVAPSVPSFGSPLPFAIGSSATQPPVGQIGSTTAQKAANSLGLTPGGRSPPPTAQSDSDEEEEELDEEAAFQKICGEKLKFEHDGEVITLETTADIKAWINQRRSQYPTRQRVEQKRQERHARMEERRRIESETAVGIDLSNTRTLKTSLQSVRPAEKVASTVINDRADVLRQKLQQQKVARETDPSTTHDTRGASLPDSRVATVSATDQADDEIVGKHATQDDKPSNASLASESDSESNVSSAPEAQTSKGVPPSTMALARTTTAKRPCHFYRAGGKCRYGRNCHYDHARYESVPTQVAKEKKSKAGTAERKTLLQRLVEQQQEGDDKLALQAIKYLGNMGWLRPPTTD